MTTPDRVGMPLTAAQRGIWMGQRLAPGNPVYWTAEALSMQGPLDVAAFARAVDHTLRHALSLHMRVDEDGIAHYPAQPPDAGACEPALMTLPASSSDQDGDATWSRCCELMTGLRPPAPDMGRDALFRHAVIRLAADHHVWVLWAHHLVIDGYGFALLTQTIAQCHGALSEGRPMPSLAGWSMAKVVDEDLTYQASPACERAAAFWRGEMADVVARGVVQPLTEAPLSATVRRARRQVPAAELARWDAAAHRAGCELVPWLAAGVARSLAQRQGREELVLGWPVMNRLGSVAVDVPCMAMNIVPLHLHVRSDLAAEAAQAACAQQIAARWRTLRPHQRYRYERLRQDLSCFGGRRRLFGPVLNIMPFDRPLAMPGLVVRSHAIAAGPVEDLAVNLVLHEGALQLNVEACALRHGAASVAAWADELLAVWRAACRGDAAGEGAGEGPAQSSARQGAMVSLPSQLSSPLSSQPPLHPLHPLHHLHGAPLSKPVSVSLNTGLSSGSSTGSSTPPATPMQRSVVLAAIARHAAQRPDAPAVSMVSAQGVAAHTLSYAGLHALAQQHAEALRAWGGEEGARVVVMLPRAPRTLAVMLAVWLCGACYIPLDPATPAARLERVLQDAQPDLVVTQGALAERFGEAMPAGSILDVDALADGLLERRGGPGQAASADRSAAPSAAATRAPNPSSLRSPSTAYVIYTSGSTGQPNGVAVGHGALAHFLAAAGETYRMAPSDRMLQFAPLHFDASVEELFLPLMAGASVVMRDDAMLASPARFLAACRAQGLTILDLPTAYWHELAGALADDPGLRADWPPAVRLLIIGGEAAQAESVRRWRETMPPDVVLLNTYGPTEATVICCTAVLAGPDAVDLAEGVPIGVPLPGVTLTVAPLAEPLSDADPHRVRGELLISGPTLAEGYLGNPTLTERRFGPRAAGEDSGGTTRCYRTGDLVALNSAGLLVFAGRLDDEVKISGHRVDPAEVEAALRACPGVSATVVLAQAGASGHRLVAFYVAQAGSLAAGLDTAAWRTRLLSSLPAPAVPTRFVPLAAMPLNHNNKVDRAALRRRVAAADEQTDMQTDRHADQHDASSTAILTEMEALVAAVWRAVLGDPGPLHPDSDFFALGGASLRAIQASIRLGAALQREVPASLLFAHPTLGELAQALLKPVAHHPPPLAAGQELAPLLPIQRAASDASPALFCIHPAEGLSWCYFGLCRHLPGIAIWGLQSPGILGEPPASFPALIEAYIGLIRQARPHGPYALLGWSSGGGIAHALAARLQADGERVSLLAMMDAYPATIWAGQAPAAEGDALEALLDVIGASAFDEQGNRLPPAAMRALLRRPGSPLAALDEALHERLIDNALHGMQLYRTAQHDPVAGPLLYCRAAIRGPRAPADHGWTALVQGDIEVIDIDSDHNGMSQPAPLAAVGAALARRLGLPRPTHEPDEQTDKEKGSPA